MPSDRVNHDVTQPEPLKRVGRHAAAREPGAVSRGIRSGLPLVLLGTFAISALNILPAAEAKKPKPDRANNVDVANGLKRNSATPSASTGVPAIENDGTTIAALAPSSYRVVSGDTVSAIAARFGLSTASVLAMNGLGWKSMIFPAKCLR